MYVVQGHAECSVLSFKVYEFLKINCLNKNEYKIIFHTTAGQ